MNLPMDEVSALTRETARNANGDKFHALEKGRRYHSLFLSRLAPEGTQKTIAQTLELSEPTISRSKEDAERVLAMLACLGLKVVDDKKTCVPATEIKFLRELYATVTQQAPWLLSEDE